MVNDVVLEEDVAGPLHDADGGFDRLIGQIPWGCGPRQPHGWRSYTRGVQVEGAMNSATINRIAFEPMSTTPIRRGNPGAGSGECQRRGLIDRFYASSRDRPGKRTIWQESMNEVLRRVEMDSPARPSADRIFPAPWTSIPRRPAGRPAGPPGADRRGGRALRRELSTILEYVEQLERLEAGRAAEPRLPISPSGRTRSRSGDVEPLRRAAPTSSTASSAFRG